MSSKDFPLLNLDKQTMPLRNPSDATLASLSMLIYPRLKPEMAKINIFPLN